METLRRNLVLSFETEKGEAIDLKILKPKESLTPSQIKAQMEAIVATNAFGKDDVATMPLKAAYDTRTIDIVDIS